MSRSGRRGRNESRPPYQREWRSARALEGVRELNEHLLEVMGGLATSPSAEATLIGRCRDLWRDLDAAARKRAAQSPVLLMDLHFQNEGWWRRAVLHTTQQRKGPRCIPAKQAAELSRATLMLAWPVARDDRCGAAVLFGMASEVASLVGGLGPQHIDRIASRHSRELRPRWSDTPGYWESLLSAAKRHDDDALCEVHLHGLHLLGGELLNLASRGTVP